MRTLLDGVLRSCSGLLLAVALVTGGGCSREEPAPRGGGKGKAGSPTGVSPSGPLTVVVSIPPLKGIIEPLLPAGSHVDVLIPPGVNEHGYEIPPSRLMALGKADLVVYVGLGLEPQVEKMLDEHPQAGQAVVAFANVIGEDAWEAAPMPAHDDHDHAVAADAADHHDEDDDGHDHHGVDPHLWLDPGLVKQLVVVVAKQTVAIAEARKLPDAATLDGKRDALLARVDAVDTAYADFAQHGGHDRAIVVTHNAYSRLAARYDLTVVPLSGLAGGEPSPAAIQRAIETVRTQGGDHPGAVYVEPQMADGPIRRVAEATGARVLILDPLGDGDWFKLMNDNLNALKEGVSDR